MNSLNYQPPNTPLKWWVLAFGISFIMVLLVLLCILWALEYTDLWSVIVAIVTQKYGINLNDILGSWDVRDTRLIMALLVLLLMGAVAVIFYYPQPRQCLQFVSNWLLKRFGHPQPANTYPLEALAGDLYPNTSTAPALLGRDTELEALAEQCRQARPNRLRVVSVWGPQGIGKTHLLYAFGKKLQHNAQKVLGQNSPTWRVWVLKRKFEPQALLDSLPTQPCLLLWDDISLSDEGTKTRLATLRQLCTQRAQPLLIMLTTWSEQSGLTANDRGVDAELPCPPLDSASAQRLYADVQSLPESWRGHPLLLRLLQEAGGKVSVSNNNLQAELWKLCLDRADALIEHYQAKAASDDVLCAIAVASSGDALPLADVAQVSEVEASIIQKTLKNLLLFSARQGLPLVAPLRPDLIGWAFAHQVLQAVPAQRLQTWATLVWHYGFFDTGRFLEYAQQADFPRHPWVQALRNSVTLSAPAALNRAKAAANAINNYGRAQRWDEIQAELAVCQDLAQNHPDNAEIQLARAQATVNAINHYGSAQRWDEMQAELAVCQELAQKHPDNAEIQLRCAQAAVNAIGDYGGAQRWDEMQAELAVCQDIAQKHPDHAEIQLARAQAAVNAINHYGSAQQRWDEMQAELAVCQDIAQKHPAHAEIQLERAKAAVNAIVHYGSAQRWDEVQAELVVCQDLAQNHPDHAEIQLRRAKAAVNAINSYGSAQMWSAMQAELAVCQDFAQKHPAHAEIQLERAKAAVNAINSYGSAQMWKEMQAELAVCQKIAERFPNDAAIQELWAELNAWLNEHQMSKHQA